MSKPIRRAGLLAAGFLLIFLAACGIGFYLIQTGALQRHVRARLIDALAKATGGRVELREFGFNWRTRTVTGSDLVVHGREAAEERPLLAVRTFQAELKLISLAEREVRIVRLSADRPQVHLIVRPDGSTNLPKSAASANDAMAELFALNVARYELRNGSFWFNAKERRFDVQGEDLRSSATYQRTSRAYGLMVETQNVTIEADCCRGVKIALTARAQLRPTSIDVQQLSVRTAKSTLAASGTLRNFAQPTIAARYHAETVAHDLARILGYHTIQAGDVQLDGAVDYDGKNGWSGNGRLRARNLAYTSPHMTFGGAEFVSKTRFAGRKLWLQDIDARLIGGTFKGHASMDQDHAMKFDGRLAGVGLRQLAAAGRLHPIPWDGVASGTVSGGTVAGLHGDLEITPGGRAPALSGRVAFAASRYSSISFADSELQFPHTQVRFNGSQSAGFELEVSSTDLADVEPALQYLDIELDPAVVPVLRSGGTAHFSGSAQVTRLNPAVVAGNLTLTRFRAAHHDWDRLQWHGTFSASGIDALSFALDAGKMHAAGKGQFGLRNWRIAPEASLRVQADYENLDLAEARSIPALTNLPRIDGLASGTLDLSGSLGEPDGGGHVAIQRLSFAEETLARLEADFRLDGNGFRITRGNVGGATGDSISFTGTYKHAADSWRNGEIEAEVRSKGFALSQLALIRRFLPDVSGRLGLQTSVRAQIAEGSIRPLQANGTATLENLAIAGENIGTLNSQISTRDENLNILLAGDLRGGKLKGNANLALTPANTVSGNVHFDRLRLATLREWLLPKRFDSTTAEGSLRGGIEFLGPLDRPKDWRYTVRVEQMEIHSLVPAALIETGPRIELHNTVPIVLDVAQGVANIRSLELAGEHTQFRLGGSASYREAGPLNLNIDGLCNLRVLQLLDPAMEAEGDSTIKASITGTLRAPLVAGKLELRGASFGLKDSLNGFSKVNGRVTFNQDRATIDQLQAEFGGGRLAFGGFVTFGGTAPLAYHLEARADDARIRYTGGISVTTDANLRLTGTSTSSVLSGSVTVGHVVFNPSTDVGNVLTNFSVLAPAPANRKTFLTSVQLDFTVESAPNMQLSTALSRDVEAQIDLRLRGTPERPILLGTVSANQGDIRVFGSRYTINRGEVNFLNTTRIEPVLDLDLQTQARGINVDITISGTLNRLNINYRSDPPLQPRDIIALLTVGRTPQEASNVQTTQVALDTPALQSGASSVLGQAISPPSGRLSKLFGITNIKIDPLVQGITNTPQSRLTLEQQISRSITVTYVTNLEQTSEQIFRLEWAINREYSVIAVRDDNGEFGIDFQYKRRFK